MSRARRDDGDRIPHQGSLEIDIGVAFEVPAQLSRNTVVRAARLVM
jgi:hypothetical protein